VTDFLGQGAMRAPGEDFYSASRSHHALAQTSVCAYLI
jgi:hypothetical protein